MSTHSSPILNAARRAVRAREVILGILLCLLTGITVYVAQTNTTSFGLVQPIRQDFPSIVTDFPTEILYDTTFLEFDVQESRDADEQVSAALIDPRQLPEPVAMTAVNTKVGNAIVLTWELPKTPTSLYSTIDRIQGPTTVRLAEHIAETTFVDDTVVTGETYTYTVTTVAQDPKTEKWYESARGISATVQAIDDLAPLAPTQVSIAQDDENDVTGLRITWVHPEHASEVRIYRSDRYGQRGVLLSSVETSASPEYRDETAQPYTTYWYTLVSVDAAGNMSSDDVALPTIGNTTPFEYTVITGE